eukprot:1229891-Pyramimonas_sp.AAC.1
MFSEHTPDVLKQDSLSQASSKHMSADNKRTLRHCLMGTRGHRAGVGGTRAVLKRRRGRLGASRGPRTVQRRALR